MMRRFTVVVREEQHYTFEAASEQEIRDRIKDFGPPSGWPERPPLIENHDEIVSITADDEPFD